MTILLREIVVNVSPTIAWKILFDIDNVITVKPFCMSEFNPIE
jgi:hypothetical protein